jgi:hypothetical protein
VAWQTNVLVVANRTAASDDLIETLRRRARSGPTSFTLLVPAPPSRRAEARDRLDDALARMRAEGLEVVGKLGVDSNPMFALCEEWDPARFDEIVISTFPSGVSHWLNLDLPQRVARFTDAPVEHVVAAPERVGAG